MTKLILRRILQMIPVLLIVLVITFVVTRRLPGNTVLAVLGPEATPEMVAQMTEEMHLNDSIPVQFFYYASDILKGDFGTSISFNRPVVSLIASYLPNTLQISLISMALAIVVGLCVGTLSAVKQYTFWDYLATVIALVGVSIPRFWLALMLVLVFSVNLGILPPFGMGTGFVDTALHMVMPCICLMVAPAATFTRITRSSMLQNADKDYITMVTSQGVPKSVINRRFLLKPSVIPTITVMGMDFAAMFGNAFLVERIFNWPGLSSYGMTAILNKDTNAVCAVVLIIGLAFVGTSIVVDIIAMILDPRMRQKRSR